MGGDDLAGRSESWTPAPECGVGMSMMAEGSGPAMANVTALLALNASSRSDASICTVAHRDWVNVRLRQLLPGAASASPLLTDAVREACLSRGKRVRPVLAMLSAAHFGGRDLAALDFGCALELVHAASLILDDLPCMDNAQMRRGHPTLHRRFGEDTAVLSAIALLNQAYAVIARDAGLAAETRLALNMLLSECVGFDGLVTGQIRDLRDPEAFRDEAALTSLNHQKTSVLFIAALVGGALIAGADRTAQASARAFAGHLGLAFQLWDDLQDSTSTLEAMGKDAGQDAGRVTFVSLWGVERTRAAIGERISAALEALGSKDCALALYTLDLFHNAGYGG
jgi:geranylgeranyl diphosphate synthase type II